MLKDVLAAQIPALRAEIKELVKAHGEKVISEVTIAQLYGGMRGVKALICDTSLVEPDRGLILRGHPINELTQCLPDDIFFLLCTGRLPSTAERADLQRALAERADVPDYVWDVMRALPADSHPMSMLVAGIIAMQHESVFAHEYAAGTLSTDDYWIATLEDALTLLARMPGLAAGIYRLRFGKGDLIPYDKKRQWGANYAHMLGIPDPSGEFTNLINLYLVLHSDHEGGNVSAFSCATVGSALSDAYYSVGAGLSGLAGPLHGLANQECLAFVLDIRDHFKGVPSDEQLVQYAWDKLNSGHVIPGYGHAVLRATDPRFTAFHEFGKRVCPGDEVFQIVDKMFRLIPDVLKKQGKAKNPYPNVDAGSGALLHHFGMTEVSYYTVLFSVSRAMGMLSQLVIARAMGYPIIRPKSVQTDWVKAQCK
ncbi:citrate (Si)-synthase [bacterium]|nr:citrate (Si)-synthase [bacterium]